MKNLIMEGIAMSLPHNVQGRPTPRSMMPQLKLPDLKKYKIERNTQFPLSQIRPVQTERVPGLVKKVYDNFDGKDKPFILDKDNKLVNGHHRYDAARLLGKEVVDAIIIKDMTIDELITVSYTHLTLPTIYSV